ncbi:MAG: histidine kinase [Actinobacteria bacterium]|nr:histidine kinase [Actinomycetota bacterium]
MSDTVGRRRAWGRAAPWLAAIGVVLIAFAMVVEQTGLWGVPKGSEDGPFFSTMLVLATLAWGGAGALIGARRPENPISLVLAGEALLLGVISFSETYSRSDLPFTSVASSVFSDVTLIPLLLAVPLLLLLFPTGRPPSPRWTWVGWLLAASAVFGVFGLIVRGPDKTPTPALAEVLLTASGFAGLAGSVLAIVSVVMRFRRSRGEERAQMRWLASIAVLGAALFVLNLLAEGLAGEGSLAVTIVSVLLLMILTVGLPASIVISILRYRLYELDVVIRKTVIFVILAALIMVVSLGMLLLLSTLTFAVPEEAETAAIAAATLAVGLVAWPLWKLARRISDRVVFGGRSSPYEVLTQFAERVGETYSSDDVLPRMAEVLGRATGAEVARVWLRVGDELRPEASWPTDAPAAGSTPAEPGTIEPETSFSAEVRHLGELLGALDVATPANDPMNPSKERLVRDLAAQAGPMLHNVLLVEDLRESRRRIVAAQDERAKKLERNIHDGAQQQLVALAVKLRLADQTMDRDPPKAHELLAQLQAETNDALETLRDLARGIYPPLLADRGLAAAIEAQVRKTDLPISLQPDGVGRFTPEIEATVYFCVLEAVQNVAKYANPSAVTIRLQHDDAELEFEVRDDGVGFEPDEAATAGSGLQGMADRLDAVGGTLEIASALGEGTRITGRLPAG